MNHAEEEFARGEVHNNTAESFNAQLERTKLGVFHWFSKPHMKRYINETAFRWNHRSPEKEPQGRARDETAARDDNVGISPLLCHLETDQEDCQRGLQDLLQLFLTPA